METERESPNSLTFSTTPVATIAPCPEGDCPRNRAEKCDRNGCPGQLWADYSPYDVPGDGEVVRLDSVPGEIQTDDFDTGWFPCKWGNRGKAAQWYAHEVGCEFTEVRATVEWLRQITEYVDAKRATNWSDDDLWHRCEADDPGAHKFWRCELR